MSDPVREVRASAMEALAELDAIKPQNMGPRVHLVRERLRAALAAQTQSQPFKKGPLSARLFAALAKAALSKEPLFQIEITEAMGARLVFNEPRHLLPGQRFDCYPAEDKP